MFPNEILLEIVTFLNKNDLAHFIFTNRNIYKVLVISETVKFYRFYLNNSFNMLKSSMHSLFIFKTIYYSFKSITLLNRNNLLIIASENGHLEVAKFLVKNGTDVTANDNYAICWASTNGHLEVVKFLVAHGSDLTTNYNIAVSLASKQGHLEVVKFLVANGSDLTANYNVAVSLASKQGHSEVVRYLVANGAVL